MNEFLIFSKLGIEHIFDLEGFDHMLFLITLCAVYKLSDWKKIGILVTAFTIGHSVTLALSSLKILTFNPDVIEFLIPVTIFLTALVNISKGHQSVNRKIPFNYLLALVFGLIHGMGFSNFFVSMMAGQSNIAFPLFSFNIGIEIGQLLIVAAFFLFNFALTRLFKIVHRDWNLVISGAGAGISVTLLIGILTS